MNFEEKINNIKKNQLIRRKAFEAGIYPLVGPTGPKGDSLKITGTYDSYEELINLHPSGSNGDCYIINGDLYAWSNDTNTWHNSGNIKGPKGNQGEQGIQGIEGKIGPTGPQGIKGEKGDAGPTGPRGAASPTGYDAIAFASYLDTKKAGVAQIGNTRVIPGNSSYLTIVNGTDIQVKRTSVCEIVLCGRISGVTQNTGASFSLINTDTNSVISDLSFVLEAGNTPDMDFSEMTVVDIIGPATLQLKTTVSGSDEISFTEMNILIKRYTI